MACPSKSSCSRNASTALRASADVASGSRPSSSSRVNGRLLANSAASNSCESGESLLTGHHEWSERVGLPHTTGAAPGEFQDGKKCRQHVDDAGALADRIAPVEFVVLGEERLDPPERALDVE